MKRILFILFMLSLIITIPLKAQVQWVDTLNGKAILKNASLMKTNKRGPLPVELAHFSYNIPSDTLNNTVFGDTISIYSPKGQVNKARAVLEDIPNSSIDSLISEIKLPNGVWVQVGAKNLLTGNIDQYLIPGDGKINIWEIVAERCNDYRIRRINKSYKARIKSYVTFWGVSP